MRINNNTVALQTQAQLLRTNRKIALSMQRMSSGLRINSVRDDAAGLAIANRLRTQTAGLRMAERNALDGISLAQTAESALAESTSILQRIRELSVQAANDSNTPEDRQKMQLEINALLDELDGIAGRTSFNGRKLLEGGMSRLAVTSQNGVRTAGVARGVYVSEGMPQGTLQYDILRAPAPAMAQGVIADGTSFAAGSFTLNGISVTVAENDGAAQVLQKLRETADMAGVTVHTPGYPPGGTLTLVSREPGAGAVIDLKPPGSALLAVLGLSAGETRGVDAEIGNLRFMDAYGAENAALTAGLSAAARGGCIEITAGSGRQITLELLTETGMDGLPRFADGAAIHADGSMPGGARTGMALALADTGALRLQVGAGKEQTLVFEIADARRGALGLAHVNVGAREKAEAAIGLLDAALSRVLDAQINRLEHTITSVSAAAYASETATSRIADTDMAMEMTNLTQLNILAQAGISILAQANQRPQQILQLMR